MPLAGPKLVALEQERGAGLALAELDAGEAVRLGIVEGVVDDQALEAGVGVEAWAGVVAVVGRGLALVKARRVFVVVGPGQDLVGGPAAAPVEALERLAVELFGLVGAQGQGLGGEELGRCVGLVGVDEDHALALPVEIGLERVGDALFFHDP